MRRSLLGGFTSLLIATSAQAGQDLAARISAAPDAVTLKCADKENTYFSVVTLSESLRGVIRKAGLVVFGQEMVLQDAIFWDGRAEDAGFLGTGRDKVVFSPDQIMFSTTWDKAKFGAWYYIDRKTLIVRERADVKLAWEDPYQCHRVNSKKPQI